MESTRRRIFKLLYSFVLSIILSKHTFAGDRDKGRPTLGKRALDEVKDLGATETIWRDGLGYNLKRAIIPLEEIEREIDGLGLNASSVAREHGWLIAREASEIARLEGILTVIRSLASRYILVGADSFATASGRD